MKKKLFKGIGTFIIIIITLILIKNNVKLTKAEPESIESKSQVTTLNNNSDLEESLGSKQTCVSPCTPKSIKLFNDTFEVNLCNLITIS